MIRLGALEARQKRMVDVNAASRQFAGELVGQHLHVAREHDEIGFGVLDDLPDRVFCSDLVSARHRQIVKRNVAEFDAFINSRADGSTRWRSGSSVVRRAASGREYRQGNDRISTPSAARGALSPCREFASPSRTVGRCRRNRLAAWRGRTLPEVGVNITRMKNLPVSTSSYCWASRMFCPFANRKVETADTMPGRSDRRVSKRIAGWAWRT